MAFEHVIDEALCQIRVGRGSAQRLAILEHDIIYDRECGHQFGTGALRQQRLLGLRDLYDEQAAGFARRLQTLDVFGQQRVKMTRDPARGTGL